MQLLGIDKEYVENEKKREIRGPGGRGAERGVERVQRGEGRGSASSLRLIFGI